MKFKKEIRELNCGCVVEVRTDPDGWTSVPGYSAWCKYAYVLFDKFRTTRGNREATEAISSALASHAIDD
ncbi:hypothetical protein [Nonomuraea candida]|uniref:hypothetical protein n=1 Tax=Nonomuraea candida TaxID=359159 RepID=UPI0012FBFAD9|nr:hypothetical protein [Nonomuraea candida]